MRLLIIAKYLMLVMGAFACTHLFAHNYPKSTKEILLLPLSQQQRIDSLFRFSLQHYYYDVSYFKEISRHIISLSEKEEYEIGQAKGYILSSLVANEQADLSQVYHFAQQALLHIPQEPASEELALALYCKGNYLRRKKRDREALETLIQGLEVAEKVGYKRMEASFNNLLGIMYVGRAEYDRALDYYDKVFAIAKADNDKGKLQQVYTNKGIVYMRQQRYSEAIRSHYQALAIAKEMESVSEEAFVYNDLGATYLESNYDLGKAIDYLKKSIEIREQLAEKNEIAYTYNYLGQAFGKQGNKNAAIFWIRKALETSKSIGNNKQQYEALEQLAEQFHQFNDHDSAYYYLKNYLSFRDSIRKLEQTETIEELLVQFETTQKDQEISILTQKNKIQQLGIQQRNLYLFLAIVLIVVAVVSIYLLYKNKKAREERLVKGAALEAELLKLETQHTLQADRLRISRDLHDNIGANLTFIHTSLNERSSDLSKDEQIKEMIAETINELRRTVWLINKSAVTLEEWVIKLRDYYKKIPIVHIAANVNESQRTLSSKQATAFFRIIQEAVNNALKHANATRIEIRIQETIEGLCIAVVDNGIGFEQGSSEGFGLENMTQNAKDIEGIINIESKPNQGTAIKVTLK
jgi:signal transduction histidine kinase